MLLLEKIVEKFLSTPSVRRATQQERLLQSL